jgi:hypothetical protein
MDHKHLTTSAAPEVSNPGTAQQAARMDKVKRRLEEMQLRMSIVVYNRRTMRVLIDDLEMSCPNMSDELRGVLASARNHLELSEKFEDAEYPARRVTGGSDNDERLQPLLSQVYKTWRVWQTAHSMCMHRIAGTGYAGSMRTEA